MTKFRIVKRRTVAAAVSAEEYEVLHAIASKNKVSLSQYLRAVIVDVIAEESDVQCYGYSRCQTGGENGEARGAAAA